MSDLIEISLSIDRLDHELFIVSGRSRLLIMISLLKQESGIEATMIAIGLERMMRGGQSNAASEFKRPVS